MRNKFFTFCLFMIITLYIWIPSSNVYAKGSTPKDISTDSNGSVQIELFDSSAMTYKITFTPNDGYALDTVKLYYDNNESFYILHNPLQFEDVGNGKKIWFLKSQKNYDRQDIDATFRKTGNEGTLILTAIEDMVSYGKDIKMKVQLTDSTGKTVKVSRKGDLYLYAPLTKLYYSSILSKESGSISDSNIICIDSTKLNGTSDLVFSGYYEDEDTGFATKISKVAIKIASSKNAIELEDSIQKEGQVLPITATTTPNFFNIPVTYKIRRNNSYIWTSEVPQWPGTYEVQAVLSKTDTTDEAQATATLTVIKDDLPDTYKSKSYISSNNPSFFAKAILKKDILFIEGTYQDRNIIGCEIIYGTDKKAISLTGEDKSISESIDISSMSVGTYDIKLWLKNKESGKQDVSALDLILIKEKDDAYFLESQATEINQNYIKNMNRTNSIDNSFDLSDPKYAPIIMKAKEITKVATSEYEKIQLIYKWVVDNISYNYDQYYYDKNISEQDSVSVFKFKKAICGGYSNLMHDMLLSVGIQDVIISAFARVDGDYRYGLNKNERHAWNMVYSSDEKRWILIDTTWGSRNRFIDGEFEYNKSNLFWFDCSVQAFSRSHSYTFPEVTAGESETTDIYTIKVGDSLTLYKPTDQESEYYQTMMRLHPGEILRTTNGFEVKAIEAGVCDVSIDITYKNGETFTKDIVVKVIDPTFVETITDGMSMRIDIKTNISLDDNLIRFYTFDTNDSDINYVIRCKNNSSKGRVYCAIYDGNGIKLDWYTCEEDNAIDCPVNLEKNTRYYIKMYAEEVGEAGNVKCQLTVDSQKNSKDKLYYTKVKIAVGKTEKLEVTELPSGKVVKSVKWEAYGDEVATVSSDGMLKTIRAGSAFSVCTVICKDGSKYTKWFDIDVRE